MNCAVCNYPVDEPIDPDNPIIAVAWGEIPAGADVEFGTCEACGNRVMRAKQKSEENKNERTDAIDET